MSNLSSPFSTGSGGSSFEHKVQAAFIATLLVGGELPIFRKLKINSIRLQAREAGFETDDLVASLSDSNNLEHKLLAQIKHTISVSVSDDAFKKSIIAAWHDFNNPKIFIPDSDAIALITGPLSGTILNHFRTILDWSRYCTSGDEFIAKVGTEKFSSEKKQTFLSVLIEIINKEKGRSLTNDEIWKFCKVLYLINYDFDQGGSVTESNAITMIKLGQKAESAESPDLIWSRILEFTQNANQNAATITLDTIPSEIQSIFDPQTTITKSDSIVRLKQHGKEILNIIDDSLIGQIHIERSDEINFLRNLFNNNHYLIVTGEAGIGKSALIKNFIDKLSIDYPVFVFKAEEFSHPHIDQVLSSININDTFSDLSARFSMVPNKVLFIDSTERLFESKHQEAFKMLLARIKNDSSWKLIIVCRGYAIEQVRNHLCFPLGIIPETYIVPKLTGAELNFILDKAPRLKNLLSNERLKGFLSNPFYLNQAMKIPWESHKGVEELSKRAFKSIIWNTIIKNDVELDQGMPFRRESCFQEIAVLRAKTMRTFVNKGNCDPTALTKLIQDHLIVDAELGFAPTHDLLEDWAVERWISSLYEEYKTDPPKFYQNLGTEPAIRRAFRHWSRERLDSEDSENQIKFITNTVKSDAIPQYWQDDIITSMLMTEKLSSYLNNEKEFLFSNEKKMFIRILHLLRVACKGPDEFLLKGTNLTQKGINIFGTIFLKPLGPGWPAIIRFIYDHIDEFDLDHYSVVCRTIEDYLSLVRVGYLPPVAREAGLIGLYFLKLLKEKNVLRSDDTCIKIIIKVPGAIKKEITDLINYELENYLEHKAHRDRIIVKHLSNFMECAYLCEAIPDLVIKAALETWFINDDEQRRWNSRIDMEEYFGLTDHLCHKFFPASGYQGPFFFLLNNHPQKAINFIIELVNRCTEFYANSTLDKGNVDSPKQVMLNLSDGRSITLWGSERLWSLYRGTTVGPDLLQSALMALENWLFSQVEQKKDIAEAVDTIIEKAESVALVSILVSLAIAYPFLLKDRALSFLKTQEFFEWDFIRQNRDSHHVADIRNMMGFPSRGGTEDFQYEERKESQKRKHRQYNLEYLTINLQATEMRDRVSGIIDTHLKKLPPIDKQNYSDKTWRIALQRMDIRKYTPEVYKERQAVVLEPTKLDDDLEQMIADGKPEQNKFANHMKLFIWAKTKYDRKEEKANYYHDLKEPLKDGKRIYKEIIQAKQNNEEIVNEGGPAFFAAICVRDHLNELSKEDIKWCFEVLKSYLVEEMDSFDSLVRHSKFDFHGSRPAAFIMPLFLGVFGKKYDAKVKELVAVALTHASDEVRWHATSGVRTYLFEKDPDYARTCFGGLIEYSKIELKLIPVYHERYGEKKAKAEKKIIKKIYELRERIVSGKSIISDENWNIDFETYSTFKLQYALSLVVSQKAQKQYINLYHSTLNAIIENIQKDEKGRSRKERHFEFEYLFANLFARFALNQEDEDTLYLCKPITQAVLNCPEIVSMILPHLFYAEDEMHTGKKFWIVWQKVAEQVCKHPAIGERYLYGHHKINKIVRTLLLSDVKWKKDITEWKPLTEHEAFVYDIAYKIGYTGIGFSALVSLLESAIGEPFLPKAFIWLKDSLKKSSPLEVFSKEGTAFLLENVLRKFIHGYDFSQLRSNEGIVQAIINLLDALVDNGSSVAFQLREYIVTPFGGVITLQF